MKKDAYCMTKNDKRMRRWRILLGILIVCNIAVIFLLSSQNAAKSAALSEKITIMLVELFAKDAEKTTPTEPPTTNQGGGSADSTVPPEGTNPKDPMENLTEEEKELVRENHATVREVAHQFNISKSTVHKDVTQALRRINPSLYDQVKTILDKNKDERHLRGGEATKKKYLAAQVQNPA